MPTYGWRCKECGHEWDVFTTIAHRDDPETCSQCPGAGERTLSAPSIDKTAAGGWNQQSYNPGLGCWTKSTKHAEQIAKSRGLEPVGNEPAENLHRAAEKQQAATREQRWRDADRVLLYD